MVCRELSNEGVRGVVTGAFEQIRSTWERGSEGVLQLSNANRVCYCRDEAEKSKSEE